MTVSLSKHFGCPVSHPMSILHPCQKLLTRQTQKTKPCICVPQTKLEEMHTMVRDLLDIMESILKFVAI